MKRYLAVLLVATAALAAGASRASAHHSFAATYLEDQQVTIEKAGTEFQFLFRNPHSFVHINVKQKDGSVIRYAVEWGGAGQLGGQGVTRDTLEAGATTCRSPAPLDATLADHRGPHGVALPAKDRDQSRTSVGPPAWRKWLIRAIANRDSHLHGSRFAI